MAIPKDEYERRLKAALELNGMTLADLREPLREHGLGAHQAARAAHPSDDVPISKALIHALAEILSVPESWFTAEDWRQVVGSTSQPAGLSPQLVAVLESMNEQLVELVAASEVRASGQSFQGSGESQATGNGK